MNPHKLWNVMPTHLEYEYLWIEEFNCGVHNVDNRTVCQSTIFFGRQSSHGMIYTFLQN